MARAISRSLFPETQAKGQFIMNLITRLLAIAFIIVPWGAQAAEDAASALTIDKFLVDITGGAVSAGGVVGLAKTAVQQIETSQDLVVALQPFTSGDQKTGFGLAITPARTALTPMSGYTYLSSKPMRLLGGVTLSYAQNKQDIGGASYQKSGYSIDTNYYFDVDEDPIKIADLAYETCAQATLDAVVADLTQKRADGKISVDEFDKGVTEANKQKAAGYKKCVDEAIAKSQKARWNASRMNLSYGNGSIRAITGGSSYSLGRMLTINAQVRAGEMGAIYLSLRGARDSVDPKTLATTPIFKNSSLVAARYTYGSHGDNATRALVEVSNAKASSPIAFEGVFLAAVGVDRKVAKGVWLEFRLGRHHSDANGKMQTTGLLNLNITPSAGLFASK